jgi:soluble lytic murein transglycosylase-like protein
MYRRLRNGVVHVMKILTAILVGLAAVGSVKIPMEANRLQSTVQKSAWETFGVNAPVATLAAQIHQESYWRPKAISKAGAAGLTQFMPATAADMAKRFPACVPADVFSERWAINCRDLYMASLLRSIKVDDECARWVYALRAYNGGEKWVKRDIKLATDAGVSVHDWRAVSRFNAGRSAANFKENTEYPVRIVERIAPVYEQQGWGPNICYR